VLAAATAVFNAIVAVSIFVSTVAGVTNVVVSVWVRVGVGSGLGVGEVDVEEFEEAGVGVGVGEVSGAGVGPPVFGEESVEAGLTTTVVSVVSSALAEFCPNIKRNSVRISAANGRSRFIFSPS
jgi:hypothetical protein